MIGIYYPFSNASQDLGLGAYKQVKKRFRFSCSWNSNRTYEKPTCSYNIRLKFVAIKSTECFFDFWTQLRSHFSCSSSKRFVSMLHKDINGSVTIHFTSPDSTLIEGWDRVAPFLPFSLFKSLNYCQLILWMAQIPGDQSFKFKTVQMSTSQWRTPLSI